MRPSKEAIERAAKAIAKRSVGWQAVWDIGLPEARRLAELALLAAMEPSSVVRPAYYGGEPAWEEALMEYAVIELEEEP